MGGSVSLFAPVVPEENLNSMFKALLHPHQGAPAREQMQATFERLPNPDENFIRDFQTTGFNARVWELYLFAWGDAAGYNVTRPHKQPDFLFSKEGSDVWIEAVTANPTPGQALPVRKHPRDENYLEEVKVRDDHFVPIKLGSPLYSKLKLRYWELPHVAGLPFIIAIEDFHDPSPIRDSSRILMQYLYGSTEYLLSPPGESIERQLHPIDEHRFKSKVIPSGFFYQADAEYVSAVLFSNSGTVPKFSRMGYDRFRHGFLKMIRVGMIVNFDTDAVMPTSFAYVVGDGSHQERWGEGIEVFHNPQAVVPLPFGFFPDAAEHWVGTGRFESRAPSFHPFNSVTHTFAEPNGKTYGHEDQFQNIARAWKEHLAANSKFGEQIMRELLKPPNA